CERVSRPVPSTTRPPIHRRISAISDSTNRKLAARKQPVGARLAPASCQDPFKLLCRAGVGALEQVSIDVERGCRLGVTEAPAHCQNILALGDQQARLRAA